MALACADLRCPADAAQGTPGQNVAEVSRRVARQGRAVSRPLGRCVGGWGHAAALPKGPTWGALLAVCRAPQVAASGDRATPSAWGAEACGWTGALSRAWPR